MNSSRSTVTKSEDPESESTPAEAKKARRSKEERAAAAEAKALWARAEVAAVTREEVALLLRCVKGADRLMHATDSSVIAEELISVRMECARALKVMGVPVPAPD